MKHALGTYQTARIQTSPRGHLVVILYDIIIRVLNQAVEEIRQRQYGNANRHIHKAQNILSELLAHLNIEEGGEISDSLNRLYRFYKNQLREVSQSHDREKIKRMIEHTKDLRDVWKTISLATVKAQRVPVNPQEMVSMLA